METCNRLRTHSYVPCTACKKVKEVDLYSAILWAPHLQHAHVWITVFPANYTKHSPDGATSDCSGRHLIAAYYSFINSERMKGWVRLGHVVQWWRCLTLISQPMTLLCVNLGQYVHAYTSNYDHTWTAWLLAERDRAKYEIFFMEHTNNNILKTRINEWLTN